MSHEPGTVIQICFNQPTLTALSTLASANGSTVEVEIRQAVANHIAGIRRPPSPESPQPADLSLPISKLFFSIRVRRLVADLGIKTLGDLVKYSPSMLLESRNFGVGSLDEVRNKLWDYGLNLRREDDGGPP